MAGTQTPVNLKTSGTMKLPAHHGVPIDVQASGAAVEPQTYDMSLSDQARSAIGAGQNDYQFDLSGAAPLSWSDWHASALPAKSSRSPAQVPMVGLYQPNPYRTPEDTARQADVAQAQAVDPSMVSAFKTGWRQTLLARSIMDPSERPDFPANLPDMPVDAKRSAVLNLPFEPTPEEQDRLLTSRSPQEFQYYADKFSKTRQAMALGAWTPGSMMTGMLLDYDAALAALSGGIGLAAKGGKLALTAARVGEASRVAQFVQRAGDMAGSVSRLAQGEYTSARLANAGLNVARSVAVSGAVNQVADTRLSVRDMAQFALMEGAAGFLMKRTPEGTLAPHPDIPPTPAEIKAGATVPEGMPHLPSQDEEARVLQNTSYTAGEAIPGADAPVKPRSSATYAAASMEQAKADTLTQARTTGAAIEPVQPSPGVLAMDTPPMPEPAPNGALGRAVERVFGAKDDGTGTGGYFSLYDRMRSYGGTVHKLGQMLVSNPVGNFGQSATHFARDAYLELSKRLEPIERELWQATGMGRLERATKRGEFNSRVSNLAEQVMSDLRLKAEAHANGFDVPVNPNPAIERISQAYKTSGFAERSLKYMKQAQRTGADFVSENPFYVPMQFSVDRLMAGLRAGRFTEDDAKQLMLMQVRNARPEWGPDFQVSIANKMYDNILRRGEGSATRANHFEGLPADALVEAATELGAPQSVIDGLLNVVKQRQASGSTEKMLRRRFDWDHSIKYTSEDGTRTVGLLDLQDQDLPKLLERYSRNVSGQYGLGMQGFRNNADIRDAVERVAEDVLQRTGSETHRKAAQLLTENVFAHLMGRASGEPVPPLARALNQLAGSMQLKNSGIYQIMEMANIVHAVGVKETILHVQKAGLAMKTMQAIGNDTQDAATLRGILDGKYIAAGRWKPFVTHFEDNVELPGTWVTGAAAQIHESARFANGLEYVRRKVGQIAAGVACTELEKAAAGDAKAAALMARYGLDAALLGDVKAELAAGKSFADMHKWNTLVNAKLQAVMGNVVDNWNSENRLGDIPAFMQFSTFGKAILPYMTFLGGAFNRLGRKHIQDSGSAGLAMAMTSQLVLGSLSESLKNLSAGRAADDSGAGTSYFRRVLENNPAAGWLGYATSLGSNAGGRAPAVSVVGGLVKAATDPSLKNVIATTPLLSIVPGVGAMTSLLNDSD